MKYFSVLVFLLAMSWTWGLAQQKKTYDEQVHISVQEQLKGLLAQSIQQQMPTVTELRFERFWTQVISEDEILATFNYSLVDPTTAAGATRLHFEGQTRLYRDHSQPGSVPVFNFENLIISNHSIEFTEPIAIFGYGPDLEGEGEVQPRGFDEDRVEPNPLESETDTETLSPTESDVE